MSTFRDLKSFEILEKIKGYCHYLDQTLSQEILIRTKGWLLSILFGLFLCFLWLLKNSLKNTLDNFTVFVISSLSIFFTTVMIIDYIMPQPITFDFLLKSELLIIFFSSQIFYFFEDGFRIIGENFFGKRLMIIRITLKTINWIMN